MWRSVFILLVTAVVATACPRFVDAEDARSDLSDRAESAYCSRDFRRSIDLSHEALSLAGSGSEADFDFTFDQVTRLAGASEKQHDYPAAKRHLEKLLDLLERKFGKDSLNSAFGMEALARVLAETGSVTEADALYKRVVEARRKFLELNSIPGYQLPDSFMSRNLANAARIAIKRKQWRKAQESYTASIAAMDENASLATADPLEDLSADASSSTFVGLARANWELSAQPASDTQALMDDAFIAMQKKWRTAAAMALHKAAERGDPANAASQDVRRTQDRQEELARLETEREDLMQVWFATRDGDPLFKAANDSLLKADQEYTRLDRQDQVKVEKIIGELTAECMSKSPPCNVDMDDAIARFRGETSRRGTTRADERTAHEKSIPGYEEYERKHTELDVKIGELSEEVPTGIQTQTSGPSGEPGSGIDVISIAELRRLLRPDEALVAFLLDEGGGFVWAVARDQAIWAPLGTNTVQLESDVNALRVSLEPPLRQDLRRSSQSGRIPFPLGVAARLYGTLFGPLDKLLADKRHIFFVPTGVLTSLPVHLLVTQPPDPALAELDGYRRAAWVLRRQSFSTLPGVGVLKDLRTRASTRPRAANKFIGFGGPRFDNPFQIVGGADSETLTTIGRCSPGRFVATTTLAALPATKIELKSIADALAVPQRDIYLGADATEANVKSLNETRALADFQIVYFATHGLVTGEVKNLPEPAIALTTPTASSALDDGLLTAAEITQLHLNADLVVLSACNTSSARRPGEETFSGLARAFFYAGAHALLLSHWPVDSFAAKQLAIATFARNAAATRFAYAEALRAAMLDMIEHGNPVAAHPSYWAPFVVVGDGFRGGGEP